MLKEYSYNGSTYQYRPEDAPKDAVEIIRRDMPVNTPAGKPNKAQVELTEPDLPSDRPSRRVRTKARC